MGSFRRKILRDMMKKEMGNNRIKYSWWRLQEMKRNKERE